MMKKWIRAIALGVAMMSVISFGGCKTDEEPTQPKTKIELDYLGFTPNVYANASVTLPKGYVEEDAEKTAQIQVSVKSPSGETLKIENGSVIADKTGMYDIVYTLGDSSRTEHFYVLEEGVIDGAEYEGQENLWSSADADGNCELERNTDIAYVIEGKASYKMLIDGKNSGGFPGIELRAQNMAGVKTEENISVCDFSEYDEIRFAFYNDTESIQQLGMKFYSDDGIMQSVDSLVNAYGVQPKEWVYVSVSMDAFRAYSETFSVENITSMKFFIKNQSNDFKKFYFDDFRLIDYNAPETDYSALKNNETLTFDCFDLASQTYQSKTINVTDTLVTGFENKADAIKIEPYRNGISRYVAYQDMEDAAKRTDSGEGLMYYKSGGDVWSMTFETMRKPNRKLSMLLFTDPDFSKYDYIAVDVYNPSDVSGIFTLGVASETAGYVSYQEQTTIAAKSWGTIYLKIQNAADVRTEANPIGVDIENIMEVNIGTNPNIVKDGFYIDNLRFMNEVEGN